MNEFSLHPNVYQTGDSSGLLHMLEDIWVRRPEPGRGAIYMIAGFGNYNGGVRFFHVFRRHIEKGGTAHAFLGASAAQRLTSRQLVEELLRCGVDITLVLRKRLLHAKCYGMESPSGSELVVTSGNFTGPGMSQNVEAAIRLTADTTAAMGFSWSDLKSSIENQDWLTYKPSLDDPGSPAWSLLYDEYEAIPALDESQEMTMLVLLGHADTARIRAKPGTDAGKGTQYFWLSRDAFDFFPALTIPNRRGTKATFSCIISVHFVDLDVEEDCRVTFEAENNLDFRLGTGPLRHTQSARPNDLAALTRRSDSEYELRVIRRGTKDYEELQKYAVSFVGHKGKRYGYIPNNEFDSIIGS